MKKQLKRTVPAFATEAEEAEWWFQNRKVHEKQLVAAGKTGEAQILTTERSLERRGFEEDIVPGGGAANSSAGSGAGPSPCAVRRSLEAPEAA